MGPGLAIGLHQIFAGRYQKLYVLHNWKEGTFRLFVRTENGIALNMDCKFPKNCSLHEIEVQMEVLDEWMNRFSQYSNL